MQNESPETLVPALLNISGELSKLMQLLTKTMGDDKRIYSTRKDIELLRVASTVLYNMLNSREIISQLS